MKDCTPMSVWTNPWHFITFGFGSGAMPFAPGTFGTLACIPFYLLAQNLSWWGYGILTLLLIAAATYLCGRVCEEINVHDHPGTVLDEFAGFFVTMWFAPHGWAWIVVGFVLFRFFDILKPYPIKWIDENVSGGFGVVFDDVLAGVYSLILLQIIAIPFR